MKRTQSKTSRSTAGLPPHEIVALAAYLAGADRSYVDTEDIAVKANEIAPGHFSWRKYKDQIRIDVIYKRLWDLTQPENGEYISGSPKDGWLLTVAGTSFAENKLGKLKDLEPARAKRPRKEEAWMQRERARMIGEVAFHKLRDGRESEITPADAEKFFRLDDYVIGAARVRKIQQAENTFHADPDLGTAVMKLASLLREKE